MRRDQFPRRGQVFVVSLWILVILTMLAVGLGHRVSLALRLSRYYRDRLQAVLLAKAAVHVAIDEILNDPDADLDTLQDNWAQNKKVFERIALGEDQGGFGSVAYRWTEGRREGTRFGSLDEQRKINVNAAPEELLGLILAEHDIPLPEDTAKNILIWRGDMPDDDEIYEAAGLPVKAGDFVCLSELSLVEGLDARHAEKLRPFLTVFGQADLTVNINTVPRQTLLLLARYGAREEEMEPGVADSLTAKIMALRQDLGHFDNTEVLAPASLNAEEERLLTRLTPLLVTKSDHFMIEATGTVGSVRRTLRVVFDRPNGVIVYVHES